MSRLSPAFFSAILVALFPASPGAVLGQEARSADGAGAPASYLEAMDLLESGDTIASLSKLRETTREHPDFGPAYLWTGTILSALAGELEANYPQRKRAQAALETAWRLMGDDPWVLVQYGLLLRRQQLKGDAERVLNRAWSAAEREGANMSPERRAELHYSLARIYEAWWDDWRDLVMIPSSAEVVSCSAIRQTPVLEGGGGNVSHWDASVICPERWAAQLKGLVWLSELKSTERQRMVEHFRLAFRYDPSRTDAAYRLLGHLAEADEWEEYMEVSRALVAQVPDDSRAHLFLGLGLHETGREDAADTAFATAIALLPEYDRLDFEDISPLLGETGRDLYYSVDSAGRAEVERLFFTSSDPLFLTNAQERRLEHYSRLAWAELKFGDPARGSHGWDSERGEIWVRYGRPWRQYQCCYGGSLTSTGRAVGGRHEYWGYGPRGPVFVFSRQLTYRHARMTQVTKFRADEMRISAPQLYRPRMITEVHEYPHQLARFRGSEPAFTRVEIYSAPPVTLLGALPGSSLETGAFLFDESYRELWARRLSVPVGETPLGLSYQIEVPSGKFYYGLEARREVEVDVSEARALARARDSLVVAGFPEGQLAVSDILLADALRPLVQRPSTRQELRIWPNRTLRFDSGEPVSVYFEVYGLQTDEGGAARYRVDFAVEDAEQRNIVQRIARGVTELFSRGGDQEPQVTWDRVVQVVNDRSIEYLTVELPELEEGAYAVRVRISDLASGQAVTADRVFWIATR